MSTNNPRPDGGRGPRRRREGGYLYEIPLLFILGTIFFSALYPHLESPWNHLALGGLILLGLAFYLYNRFAAGWQPRHGRKNGDGGEENDD